MYVDAFPLAECSLIALHDSQHIAVIEAHDNP
jgi:hypothetical protein